MAVYFIVCVYQDKERGWGEYEEYIRLVKRVMDKRTSSVDSRAVIVPGV